VGTLLQELSSLQLTGKPVIVQRKKKPSGAQQKRLKKQKEIPYIMVRNTRGFIGKWTMDPSVAWFYKGQLCLHRNWKLEQSSHNIKDDGRHAALQKPTQACSSATGSVLGRKKAF